MMMMKWLDARGGVPKLARGSPSFFTGPPPNLASIAEWSVLNANVLDFRYVFALSNYGANCLRLGRKKWCEFWVFRSPFVLGGTLKKSL